MTSFLSKSCFSLARHKKSRVMPFEMKSQKKKSRSRSSSADLVVAREDPGIFPSAVLDSPRSPYHGDNAEKVDMSGIRKAQVILTNAVRQTTSNSSIQTDLSSFNRDEKIPHLVSLNDDLVQEVTSLMSDKKKYKEKMKQLEEKVRENLVKIDEWLIQNQWLQQDKLAMEEIRNAQSEMTVDADGRRLSPGESFKDANDEMTIDSEAEVSWQSQKLSLEGEIHDLETALAESRQDFENAWKTAQELQASLDEAEERVDALNEELQRLRSDSLNLIEINALLQTQNKDQEATLIDLKAHSEKQEFLLQDLKAQKDSLEGDLRKNNEAFAFAVEEKTQARQAIQAMHADRLEMKEEVDRLKKLLADALGRYTDLETQKERLRTKMDESENHYQDAKHKLNTATMEIESTKAALQRERDAKGALLKEASMYETGKRELQQQVSTARSLVSMLQDEIAELKQELASARSIIANLREDASQHQVREETLEAEVLSLMSQRNCLESQINAFESQINASEVHVMKLTAGSAQVSSRCEKELTALQATVKGLESALTQAKYAANSSEHKAAYLVAELDYLRKALERQAIVAKMALPTAVVSTITLIGMACFTFFRTHKRR